ncbi:MAG: DegT/DnrJ/EryC1/StrS family aminotransferase, partial [Clostridia bacterium]
QLDRLHGMCERRNELGERLTAGIKGLPGVQLHEVKPGNKSSYWFYMLRIDEKAAGANRDQFTEALIAEGIPAVAGYIPTCVYEYDMFQNKEGFKGTHAPFDSKYYGGSVSYEKGECPVAEATLESAIRLNINEFFTDSDIDDMIHAFKKISAHYAK